MSGIEWKSTACCICGNNCGLEVQVKDDRIVCTIADGVKVEIARNAVGGVID